MRVCKLKLWALCQYLFRSVALFSKRPQTESIVAFGQPHSGFIANYIAMEICWRLQTQGTNQQQLPSGGLQKV